MLVFYRYATVGKSTREANGEVSGSGGLGASLERAFDHTLSQLERLQRMRLGQPVLPPVKVELSP